MRPGFLAWVLGMHPGGSQTSWVPKLLGAPILKLSITTNYGLAQVVKMTIKTAISIHIINMKRELSGDDHWSCDD